MLHLACRPIANLRWWIGGLLFASTIINYVDRQTLSLLAPFLKQDFHWTNTDYANILIGFRIAYSIGQTVFGRVVDRVGTRRGLSITVFLYSMVVDFNVDGARILQFCDVSVFAGSERIRQLAGGDKSGFGMVSEARARIGDGVV